MHIANVQLMLKNVCFEGKNGHDTVVTPIRLYPRTDTENYRALTSVAVVS